MIEGFNKISKNKQEETYGGWAWLVALVPMLLQSIVATVASIKSIVSDKGSIKGKDISATWDDGVKGAKETSGHKQVINYFAY